LSALLDEQETGYTLVGQLGSTDLLEGPTHKHDVHG
jgi:hypothetical protein